MASPIVSPQTTPEFSEYRYIFESPCGAWAGLPIRRVAIYVYGPNAEDDLNACRVYAAEWQRYGWQIVAEYIDETKDGEAFARLLEADHAGKHDGFIHCPTTIGGRREPHFHLNQHLFPDELYLQQVDEFRPALRAAAIRMFPPLPASPAAASSAPTVEATPPPSKKPASKKPRATTDDRAKVRIDENDPLAVLWDAQVANKR